MFEFNLGMSVEVLSRLGYKTLILGLTNCLMFLFLESIIGVLEFNLGMSEVLSRLG